MKRLGNWKRVTVAAMLAATVVTLVPDLRAAIERPKPGFRHGAQSVDELVDRFLRALEQNDREALRQLRVDKAEYLRIIMPGSAKPGQPPRRFPSQLRKYAWDSLNGRSLLLESTFLNAHGGRALILERYEFREGVKEYAGYTAHSQLGIFYRDDGGEVRELRTGSVAEVDGSYKFISYVRD